MQDLQYAKTEISENEFKAFFKFLEQNNSINAAVLFGSVARQDSTIHSDIDLIILIDGKLEHKKLVDLIATFWEGKKATVLDLPRKNSITIYNQELLKIDLLIASDLAGMNRNYMGSFIEKETIERTILFDKTNLVYDHLSALYHKETPHDSVHEASSLINYFLFNFESCSKFHAKSDGYQFYFAYNIALHTLIQLQCILKGDTQFLYNPRSIIAKVWDKEKVEDLYQLSGSIFLPKANSKKRLLLNEFYRVVKDLAPEKFRQYKNLCEAIYQRDYFWNFRDYNKHAPHLLAGKIYRSATLSLFDISEVNQILEKKGITSIVDLRSTKELQEHAYQPNHFGEATYTHAPFDPWNQPKWFEENHHQGTNRAIAYRFFMMACQESFKLLVDEILNAEGAILIHCHAGKDRTGLVIGAIQLLLGVERSNVERDYMVSGADSDLEVFKILFEQVELRGGINKFFEYQGIDQIQQQKLIKKLKGI